MCDEFICVCTYVSFTHYFNCVCEEHDCFCSDFGFEEDDGNTVCLPSDQYDVHWGIPYPCPTNDTYVISLGYRKINGDKCVGGEEIDFLPRNYTCPSMYVITACALC